ncbi:MAG: excinuclease ABC subunit UvrC [Oscillospiraceae bacterium]|nr:excinuclease ABC subunit UvrC [Oscillospiraceae bacterium]
MSDKIAQLRKKAMGLPQSPGVYIMKNAQGTIIYIGKAKSLKNRVSQYFGSQDRHDIKVLKMVSNVYDFDYILTDSEFEALLLECSLIKQHQPKYNILLKDDKGYHYIRISRDEWRRITAQKQKSDDGAQYIGPYTNAFTVKEALDEARKIFKLRDCSREFPRDIGKGRPCLNYFISQCSAPCSGKISHKDYEESVDDAISFLKGGSAKSVKEMQARMKELSDDMEFEKAAKLRDRIKAINKMNQKQKVISGDFKDRDVFALSQNSDNACFAVLRFSDFKLFDSQDFIVESSQDAAKLRTDLIKQYYTLHQDIPPRIDLDGDLEDLELLQQWLSKKVGRKVSIAIPQRGEQLRLVEMCKKNAQEKLLQKTGRTFKNDRALLELSELLGIGRTPEYIESYDISHTAGSSAVAGMIVFKDGSPFKQAYKRFEIKDAKGGDDIASMREVLIRRFNEYKLSTDSQNGFGKLPDLILLDGGRNQLNAALDILKQFELDIPVFGMVKDSKHKTRAITGDGYEISITSKRQAFTLVSKIQEEVHRFAIKYHHVKNSGKIKNSTLTNIKGIGQNKANLLMSHFKTLNAVKQADVDKLGSIKGITQQNARDIYEYFHNV